MSDLGTTVGPRARPSHVTTSTPDETFPVHPATRPRGTAAVDRPGVHGARSSGGGSGSTVVVLWDRGALDDVDDLIR
jgi:hypothetical protein